MLRKRPVNEGNHTMFQKILLPTDGSRHSSEAARFAADLALTHGGTVYPVVAVEYQYITGGELTEEMSAQIRQRIDERAARALADAAAVLRAAGAAAAEGEVREGVPADVILRCAEDDEHDLIVMGSRGVSLEDGYDRRMGSVTERVLQSTPCPVLVIRAGPRP